MVEPSILFAAHVIDLIRRVMSQLICGSITHTSLSCWPTDSDPPIIAMTKASSPPCDAAGISERPSDIRRGFFALSLVSQWKLPLAYILKYTAQQCAGGAEQPIAFCDKSSFQFLQLRDKAASRLKRFSIHNVIDTQSHQIGQLSVFRSLGAAA